VSTQTNLSFDHLNAVLERKVPGLSLAGTVPAVSESDRRSIVHLFEIGRRPDFEKSPAAWWRYALVWAAFDRNDRSAALEVDFTTGGRTVYVVGGDQDDGVTRSKSGEVTRQRLDSNPADDTNPRREVWEKIWAMLRSARASIQSGQALPIPGSYCQSCVYGELCRRHRDYGDLDDPFQDGGLA
jgi:hypothetical protein